MKYRGIIFDLDGVICHTDKYHYQAWKQVADKLGICFDETINNRLRGVSRMERRFRRESDYPLQTGSGSLSAGCKADR